MIFYLNRIIIATIERKYDSGGIWSVGTYEMTNLLKAGNCDF